jgi:hypothetical protein
MTASFDVSASSEGIVGHATVNVAAGSLTVIVDDLDPGFSVDSGLWDVHYTPFRFGSTDRRIQQGTTGVCRFTPVLPRDGTYDVYAWWPVNYDATSNAVPYTVVGNGITQTTAMNQTTNWGKWVIVGRYPLAPGSHVTVTAHSGVNAAADAVRFVYVGP